MKTTTAPKTKSHYRYKITGYSANQERHIAATVVSRLSISKGDWILPRGWKSKITVHEVQEISNFPEFGDLVVGEQS